MTCKLGRNSPANLECYFQPEKHLRIIPCEYHHRRHAFSRCCLICLTFVYLFCGLFSTWHSGWTEKQRTLQVYAIIPLCTFPLVIIFNMCTNPWLHSFLRVLLVCYSREEKKERKKVWSFASCSLSQAWTAVRISPVCCFESSTCFLCLARKRCFTSHSWMILAIWKALAVSHAYVYIWESEEGVFFFWLLFKKKF